MNSIKEQVWNTGFNATYWIETLSGSQQQLQYVQAMNRRASALGFGVYGVQNLGLRVWDFSAFRHTSQLLVQNRVLDLGSGVGP